jgi:hypothetical protein
MFGEESIQRSGIEWPLTQMLGNSLRVARDPNVQLAQLLISRDPVIVGMPKSLGPDVLSRDRRDRVDRNPLVVSPEVRVLVASPGLAPLLCFHNDSPASDPAALWLDTNGFVTA